MDMKIELIPESDTTNWHWIVNKGTLSPHPTL